MTEAASVLSMRRILTQRLELVPATVGLLRAALEDLPMLAVQLDAAVPASWPPEFVDAPALRYTIDRLSEGGEHAGWWMYFVVLARGAGARTLIGSGGYKGPPSADGRVEIGYGIVVDHQRRGYASEAALALIAHAFEVQFVERVIAETLPELTPSIGVLGKCGMRFIGAGSEPGVIRFEVTRAQFSSRAH